MSYQLSTYDEAPESDSQAIDMSGLIVQYALNPSLETDLKAVLVNIKKYKQFEIIFSDPLSRKFATFLNKDIYHTFLCLFSSMQNKLQLFSCAVSRAYNPPLQQCLKEDPEQG